MKRFEILADANCDLVEKYQKEYDISVIPGHIVMPDGSDIRAFLSWDIISKEEFYATLKKNPDSYATSPANVADFEAEFEKFAAEGKDLLVMTISSGISGAYGFACTAREQVLERHPDAKITVIDTLRFGPGFGLMVVHASLLREKGLSMEETAAWLEENKNRFHQAGWLDDLSFVAKKGRLTHAKAFFGTLAGVKPIGEFDYNGLTTVIGKFKGAKAAYAGLLEYIENTVEDPEDQIFFIAQTNRLPQAEEYKRLIEEKFHPKAVYINDVFPSVSINVGPGLMAAYYIGKPISKDLSEEKAIIDSFLAKNS